MVLPIVEWQGRRDALDRVVICAIRRRKLDPVHPVDSVLDMRDRVDRGRRLGCGRVWLVGRAPGHNRPPAARRLRDRELRRRRRIERIGNAVAIGVAVADLPERR